MKRLILTVMLCIACMSTFATNLIQTNLVGYLPDDIKVAVYMGDVDPSLLSFYLRGDAKRYCGLP